MDEWTTGFESTYSHIAMGRRMRSTMEGEIMIVRPDGVKQKQKINKCTNEIQNL